MNAGRTKKKRDPLAEYADILLRVERHAKDMRKRAKAEARAIFEQAHGCGKKTEACEDAEQPPPADYEETKEIHLPLALAMREGGDPFPIEWKKLRGALAIENLPEIRDEAKLRHDSFVALFPTDATQYGWQTIEDSANEFATFLDGLPIKGTIKKHLPRAKGVTDAWIAAEFNRHAVALVKDRSQSKKPIYEKKRGGGGGIYYAGGCTVPTIKVWIRKYPDADNAEPISGFHAGMLTDKKAIENAAKRWGEYYQGYAEAFFEWRKTNKAAPRKDFRYQPIRTVHNVEAVAPTGKPE